ncbi:hypothetical protein FI667_g16870, partial [Globisporangium splendens]
MFRCSEIRWSHSITTALRRLKTSVHLEEQPLLLAYAGGLFHGATSSSVPDSPAPAQAPARRTAEPDSDCLDHLPVAMFTAKTCAFAVVAALATLTSVSAHGQLTDPAPTFKGYGGGFPSTIDISVMPAPAGMGYSAGPDTNDAAFDTAFKALKPKMSLKDFILKYQDPKGASSPPLSTECGFSDPKGTPQALPDKLQWGTSFIHPGPCEAWCDDENVVPYTANCWVTYKNGTVPYEKAKCEGKKRLTFYWLAVHSPPWQPYINCVPLSGASSAGSDSESGSATVSADATETPTATTTAPAESSTPATTAPATSTKTTAPSTSGKKCKRKMR